MNLSGRCRQIPFPAKYLDNADAVLAMYHDQGLPVLKYPGLWRGVNITLGFTFYSHLC